MAGLRGRKNWTRGPTAITDPRLTCLATARGSSRAALMKTQSKQVSSGLRHAVVDPRRASPQYPGSMSFAPGCGNTSRAFDRRNLDCHPLASVGTAPSSW